MSQTRSSYEPTRLTAGQAATTAPTGPWDQPWAMFAVRVAAMPSPSSQRAREGTGTRCRAAYSTTMLSLGVQSGRFGYFLSLSRSAAARCGASAAAGAARVRGAVALAAPGGDRGWRGCRSAAAAPPQQVCRNRSWRLDEALSVQSGVKQGVQEGGQLAVCRAYPDPDAVGIVVW